MKIGGSLGKITEGVKKAPKKVEDWTKARVTPSANDKGGPAAPRELSPEDMAKANADAAMVNSPYGDQQRAYGQKYGLPGLDYQYADTIKDAYQPTIQQLGGLTQPVNVDPAFRNYQMQLAQQLQNQAMGQGPSLAQMQLQQATDRTMNQSLGAIKAGLGANPALAARTAALSASQSLAGMGQQSGILRLQEQQQAQQALAGLSDAARTQDMTTAFQSRQSQLNGLAQQSDAIQQSLGGIQDINRGRMGMEASSANNAAAAKQADKAAARTAQNQIVGAVVTAGTSALGSGLFNSKKENDK